MKQKRAKTCAASTPTGIGNGDSDVNISGKKENGCGNGYRGSSDELSSSSSFVLSDVEHVVCHSPYNKLVQKSFARMFFADARRLKRAGEPVSAGMGCERLEEALERWLDVPAKVRRSSTWADCVCVQGAGGGTVLVLNFANAPPKPFIMAYFNHLFPRFCDHTSYFIVYVPLVFKGRTSSSHYQ